MKIALRSVAPLAIGAVVGLVLFGLVIPSLDSRERLDELAHEMCRLQAAGDNDMAVVARHNQAIHALDAEKQTTSSRTSGWLVNENGSGVAVIINVTDKNGTGQVNDVKLYTPPLKANGDIDTDAPDGGHALVGVCSDVNINSVSCQGVLFHPTYGMGVSPWAGAHLTCVPKYFRVYITQTADGAGNDITYSVDVYTIP